MYLTKHHSQKIFALTKLKTDQKYKANKSTLLKPFTWNSHTHTHTHTHTLHQWHFCINLWQCFANMCKTFTCFAGYRWNTDITPTKTSMKPVPAFRQNTALSRFSACPTCAATQLHSYQEKTEATQTQWCLVLSSWFYASFTDVVPTKKDRTMSTDVPFTDLTQNINGSFILAHCAKGGFIDQQV